ncbi:S9 family peptidase [Sediminicola luteus]|uniref:Proline-specific endopeptidase n=1 Tax=Sediminicola luteus TaxID=319238 RepID=A0A2A4G5D0_9FLAO|nr:oligopeptidase B [Sediminicola luteus]
MSKSIHFIRATAISLIFASACKDQPMKESLDRGPIAKKIPTQLEKHGDIRVDDYYWMNDRENPEVIAHLNAENAHYENVMGHAQDFEKQLFQEMKGRIKEDDSSVPYKLNGYWYITRYEIGAEYPIYTRKKEDLEADEEVLFNVNLLAKDFDYYQMRGLSISPDNQKIAFGVDTVSRREYTIQVKDLATGQILEDRIENTTGSTAWASDNKTFFYTKKDPVTLRADKIYRHVLGTDPKDDVLVFEETDDTFSCYVYKTKSKKYLVIGSYSTLTTEIRILEANNPLGDFRVFSERTKGVEYSISHYNGDFYILTNKDGATNFKVMKTDERATNMESWQTFIAHRETVLLEDLDIFKDYYVVSERENGLNRIQVNRWDGSESYYLPFENETYTAHVGYVPDFDTQILRYSYTALGTPNSVVDFDMGTQEKEVKKQAEVLGGKFQEDNYISKRVWATARDGVKVPMSIIYHKDTPLDGTSPLLQYAYGSYGHTLDPYFSSVRLSLLDRGFIYAITHVRGGEYLGRPWYEDGKLLRKKNTFTDFIDCSKYLIAEKWTGAEHLYANGGSAGGLLMGAILNMAPELYNGVVAEVPFVDVVTTMLDDSIPLTTGEYDEWGNPNDKTYYDYMKSYSPYDNVAAQGYPHILVTTGLHDSQVQYFEPAKWVAKLREHKTDSNRLLFKIDMEVGHGGASGRFEFLKDVAKEYAFYLDLEGQTK